VQHDDDPTAASIADESTGPAPHHDDGGAVHDRSGERPITRLPLIRTPGRPPTPQEVDAAVVRRSASVDAPSRCRWCRWCRRARVPAAHRDAPGRLRSSPAHPRPARPPRPSPRRRCPRRGRRRVLARHSHLRRSQRGIVAVGRPGHRIERRRRARHHLVVDVGASGSFATCRPGLWTRPGGRCHVAAQLRALTCVAGTPQELRVPCDVAPTSGSSWRGSQRGVGRDGGSGAR
jgi:hypothetical protein